MDTIKLKTSSVSDAEALFAAARDVRMIPTKRQTAAHFGSEAAYEEEFGCYFKRSGGVFIKGGTFLEHDLTIVAKKHSNLGVAWVEITFHLSTFGTHAEVLQWLAAAFGAAMLPAIERCGVTRLDLCVDLPIPWETLFSTLSLKHVTSTVEFKRGDKRTYYMGKAPRQVLIYKKSRANGLSVFDLPPPENHDEAEGTRIEIRLTRSKVPIKSIAELPGLALKSPFDVVVVSQVDPLPLANLSGTKKHRIMAYCWTAMKFGLQAARREFGEHGNYARDIKPYVGSSAAVDLAAAWRNRCLRFFGGQATEPARRSVP